MARTSSRRERRSYLQALVLLFAGVAAAAVQILPTWNCCAKACGPPRLTISLVRSRWPPRFVLTFFAPFIMGGGDGPTVSRALHRTGVCR